MCARATALQNHFNIGALMEKGLTTRGGQLWCQKYWAQLQQWLVEKRIDPSFVVSHVLPLEEAPRAYDMMDRHVDSAVKVLLKVDPAGAPATGGHMAHEAGPAVLLPLPGANSGGLNSRWQASGSGTGGASGSAGRHSGK